MGIIKGTAGRTATEQAPGLASRSGGGSDKMRPASLHVRAGGKGALCRIISQGYVKRPTGLREIESRFLPGDFTEISWNEAALHNLYYAYIAARFVTDRAWREGGRVPMQFLLAGTISYFIEMAAQAHGVVGDGFSGGGNGSWFDWGAFV